MIQSDRAATKTYRLDPATGQPAFTGVVQVTAFAPTGVEAETLSKAALLSGRDRALRRLIHGGLAVYDDESFEVVEAPRLTSEVAA